MAESFFKAFLRFVDAEAGSDEEGAQQAPGASTQSSSGWGRQPPEQAPSGHNSLATDVRVFGDLVAEMHEALVEGRLRDCCAILGDLHDVLAASGTTGTGPSAASVSAGTPPGPAACPHCKRTVASVALHLRTCPVATAQRAAAAAAPSSADAGAPAAAPVVDPRKEIVDALAARLQAAVLEALGASNGGASGSKRGVASSSSALADVDALAPLWMDALSVPGGLGGPPTSSDNAVTAAFAAAVGASFKRTTSEVLGRLASVRGVLSAAEAAAVAAASAAAAAAGALGPEGVAASLPHRFLRRHRVAGALTSRRLGAEAAAGAPSSSSSGSGAKSAAGGPVQAPCFISSAAAVAAPRAARAALFSSVSLAEGSEGGLAPGSGDGGGGGGGAGGLAASSSGHPHMEALTAIITQGTALMEAVMGYQVPHAARRAVSAAIHEACSSAALTVLSALAEDIMLPTLGIVAQSALDHADALAALPVPYPGPPEEDPWDDILDIYIPLTSGGGKGASLPPSHSTGSLSSLTSSASSSSAPAPTAPAHEVLTISMEAVLHVLDETADQLSFACQLLERYSRAYAVTQALGGGAAAGSAATAAATAAAAAAAPSSSAAGSGGERATSSDALLVRVQELQASYVLIERGYLVTGVGHAIAACGGGWAPVAVHSDPGVRIYAWCDNAFFLLGKVLARAAATGSDIAAAATTNYVASCLQDAVGTALRTCVERCGWNRRHPQARAAAAAREAAAAAKRAKASGGSSGGKGGAGQGGSEGGGGFAAALMAALDAETAAAPGGSRSRGGGYAAPRAVPAGEDEDEDDDNSDAEGAGSGSNGSGPSHAREAGDAPGATAGGGGVRGAPAAAAVTRPALSPDALWALNSVATTGDFAAALTARALDEMAAVFPFTVPDATPLALSSSPGASAPASSSSPVAASSASSPAPVRLDRAKLAVTHPYLHGPLLQLADAATEAAAMQPRAVAAACGAACGRGVARLSAALTRLTYALSPAEYDAVQAADPLLALVRSDVIRRAGLTATAAALLRNVADALVAAAAGKVAAAVEARWLGAPLAAKLGALSAPEAAGGASATQGSSLLLLPPPPPFLAVSDLGALLMASQVRELVEAFGELTPTGSVRAAFGKLHQVATVLSIEALSDVYALAFPAPALSCAEVLALLGTRAGDLRLPLAALAALAWHSVDVVDRPPPPTGRP